MVQHSLTILFLHHSWAIVRLKRSKDEGPEAAELTVVRERCTSLLQRLEEFSVGAGSNPAESVKQAVSCLSCRSIDILGLFADIVIFSRYRCS